MVEIQDMFNALSKSLRSTRSEYHLTLGNLIKKLDNFPSQKIIVFSSGGNVGDEMSYRGYYSDLSFESQEKPKKIKSFKHQCRKSLGKTYQGYKGGDYEMGEDTPLWKAEYGNCGKAIIDIVEKETEVVLVCKEL